MDSRRGSKRGSAGKALRSAREHSEAVEGRAELLATQYVALPSLPHLLAHLQLRPTRPSPT